ncbi:HIT family protein [Lapidilactobacillus bayanensis]|uniref:HIT family protein n=1 Tax=Lapidilactobacillus bayanensis TaxID=2485998 RepID=UPI000F79A87C|nr:hypothetical protein [Lapidilactobacillus bayanensis]
MEWYENRIASAKNGTNPMVMAELNAGFAVIGDTQFLPGYSVLLPKEEFASLNDMPHELRKEFLYEMTVLGDAVAAAVKPTRLNYDILGNQDNFLHAHVFARQATEPARHRQLPVWSYERDYWVNEDNAYTDEKFGAIRAKITEYLNNYLASN